VRNVTKLLFVIFKQDLDPASKVKYWRALYAFRNNKVADRCECSVLTYTDIQECIDIVNHQYEENNVCKFQQDH
jgi:ribosome biogenesis GTPase A